MKNNIMVIATHPDDETLGCGGTLLKLAQRGTLLQWLLVTAAHSPNYSGDQIATQAVQVENVRQAYPFESLTWLKYPTTRLDTIALDSLIVALHKCLAQVRPVWVFIPNRSDVHSDHRVVFQALSAVLKPIYMRSLGVKRVLACEVISETEAAPPLPENAFLPTVFMDVGETFERKMEIMGLYKTEVQSEPLQRSPSAIRAQARLRGATIGVEYAEAFMLIREIE
jgi:LmbE family N-acetylglucosaminyl deacetylase